jgi:hypothetical protein
MPEIPKTTEPSKADIERIYAENLATNDRIFEYLDQMFPPGQTVNNINYLRTAFLQFCDEFERVGFSNHAMTDFFARLMLMVQPSNFETEHAKWEEDVANSLLVILTLFDRISPKSVDKGLKNYQECLKMRLKQKDEMYEIVKKMFGMKP